MKPEVAQRRIESFRKRFGEAHLMFAYHAAFPLALTPDLLYKLWANFQRDIHGRVLGIPWVAVADLLLSSLCDEVGHELYEMDTAMRNLLLNRLKEDVNFGQQRIHELSDFLLTYVRQQLNSSDPDVRDFAQVQRWTALAYVRPSETAHELRLALEKVYQQDRSEQVRLASLVETFAEPLSEFEPLLVYVREMEKQLCSNRHPPEFIRSKISTRRLPIYLVLDCSGSMSGDPIEAVNQGVKTLVAELKTEPYAIEMAYLSVITFDSTAQQLCPLTELSSFNPPHLSVGGTTSLGAALKLLTHCFDQEVAKTNESQKGDRKPLVFLMTDGMPTDTWEKAADELKQKKTANIIACAAGSYGDEQVLKRITEIVLKLDDLQPNTFIQFFKWVSQSIKQTFKSIAQVMADDQPINLPPLPHGIQIVP